MWPSGLRRQTQDLLGETPHAFESRSVHSFLLTSYRVLNIIFEDAFHLITYLITIKQLNTVYFIYIDEPTPLVNNWTAFYNVQSVQTFNLESIIIIFYNDLNT